MTITMYVMKNILDGIKERLDIRKERISEQEDIAIETIHIETQKKN